MHITRIGIVDVRGVGTIDADLTTAGDVPRWVVLAGRNGAGKSTVLRSLALAISGPTVARLLAESFSGWIRDGHPTAWVGARLRMARDDRLTDSATSPDDDPWVGLTWSRSVDGPEPDMLPGLYFGVNRGPAVDGGPEPALSPRMISEMKRGKMFGSDGRTQVLKQAGWPGPFQGPWAENVDGWFIAGYGPFRRLSSASSEAVRLMMSPGRPGALASLFREDASLSESVEWLQREVYLPRLEGDERAASLEMLVLRMLDDGLLPDRVSVVKIDSKGLWVSSPDGGTFPLTALSDGYRTVAGLVLDIIRQVYRSAGEVPFIDADGRVLVTAEGVVLIDEIDVHLHVTWQRRIGFWLKEHFPGIQFIVTTHSPFVCQAADPGGLIRLTPSWEHGATAEVVAGEEFNRVVNGTLDDALLTDLFGLDSTLSDRAEAARALLSELEAKAVEGMLDRGQRKELESLRAQLPTTQSDVSARVLRTLMAIDK